MVEIENSSNLVGIYLDLGCKSVQRLIWETTLLARPRTLVLTELY